MSYVPPQEAGMNREILAEFWRFTKVEIGVAVRRFFMPVRVVAQGIYQIVHESDAQQPGGTRSNDAARQPKHG
jgi:hypothetical protein